MIIERLVQSYIAKPHTIVLAVAEANTRLRDSEVFSMIKDPTEPFRISHFTLGSYRASGLGNKRKTCSCHCSESSANPTEPSNCPWKVARFILGVFEAARMHEGKGAIRISFLGGQLPLGGRSPLAILGFRV